MSKQITSIQNPLIKNILLLQEKPRERKQQQRFVIEGTRETRLAFAAGFRITDLVICRDFLQVDDPAQLVSYEGGSFGITEVTPELFNRLAYRKDQGGMIALAIPKERSLEELKPSEQPLFLVLESVEKPGNLGALLRTADAARLDGVIICDPQTDIFNPNTIRSSIGCVFTLPVVACTTAEAVGWLRSRGIRTFGTALTAEQFYHETDFTKPAAIIMGSEAFGLSQTWLDASDELIKIPMNGKIDSLNVSASAAIVVFEALRQRGFPS